MTTRDHKHLLQTTMPIGRHRLATKLLICVLVVGLLSFLLPSAFAGNVLRVRQQAHVQAKGAMTAMAEASGEPVFAELSDAVAAAAEGDSIIVEPGVYGGIVIDKSLAITASGPGVIIQGASPALTISSGTTPITGATYVQTGADPTILVTGGTLILRSSTVDESSTSDQPAIRVTGGNLDMGTIASPGSNTVSIVGDGSLIDNAGPNPVTAIGNTWKQDATTLSSNFGIEDEIFHAVDAGGGGLVTWVADNLYVTLASGSIQRGVDAAGAGDTVNIDAVTLGEMVTINKTDVTVRGAGSGATLVKATGTDPVFIVTANGVTIQDLDLNNDVELVEGIRVDGATSGLTVDSVGIYNLSNGTSGNGFGVHIKNSFSGLTVADCVLVGGRQGLQSRMLGVYAEAGTGNALSNIEVRDCAFSYHFTGVDIRAEVDGLTIAGNTFGPQEIEDCTAAVAGVYIGDGRNSMFDLDHVVISNNLFTTFGRGVYIWDYTPTAEIREVDIVDNIFSESIWSSPVRVIARDPWDGGNALGADVPIKGPLTIHGNTFTQTGQIAGGSGGYHGRHPGRHRLRDQPDHDHGKPGHVRRAVQPADARYPLAGPDHSGHRCRQRSRRQRGRWDRTGRSLEQRHPDLHRPWPLRSTGRYRGHHGPE